MIRHIFMPAVTTTQPAKLLWQKRIPTILGLGFLVVALIVGVLFIGQGAGVFAPRATAETTPKNVRITNVTDTTFTVSFMTDLETTSLVKYGTDANKTNLQIADDRVQLSVTNDKFKLHHITVKGLQPGTVYYYVIGTGGGALFDSNGSPFKISTAKKGIPTAAKTIFGTVTTESGAPAEGAVVYIKTDGAGDMSSLVTNIGSWAVPLSNARTPDGSAFATITEDSQLALVVQGVELKQTAQGSITVAEAHPVPTLTFGKGLAMAAPAPTPTTQPITSTATPTPEPAQATPTPTPDLDTPSASGSAKNASSSATRTALGGLSGSIDASSSANSSGSATTPEVLTLNLAIETTTPVIVTTQQPVITGKVKPNVKVTIEIHSDNEINDEVTSDSNGNFEVDLEELKENLDPGEHTITYSYIDPATGEEVTETETFIVQPKTTNLIAQANTTTTRAATPAPSPTPFGSSNPYPIGGATSSAQASASATSTKSATKTTASASATSTRSAKTSTASGLPVSGAIGTTLALIFGGLFFIIAGTWSYWVSAELARREE